MYESRILLADSAGLYTIRNQDFHVKKGGYFYPWDGPSSYDIWLCSHCFKVTEEVNDLSLECHLCSDWNGCNSNCTLVGVRCAPCGTELMFRQARGGIHG